MGFWEVVKNIGVIRRRLQECQNAIGSFQPDALILIDFPGFNLRIAKYASQQLIPVFYYISPKVWAWKEGRVRKIKKYVDRLYSILPFEDAFYARHNYPIKYVGNPVVEELQQYKFEKLPENDLPGVKIAYLPGSRVQEVLSSVEMIKTCALKKPDYQFFVAGVENIPLEYYSPLLDLGNVHLKVGKTYEVLKLADVAIVTSGTATLETALLNVPQVVCYRTSKITYLIAKAFVKVRFLSLVNLIQNEQIVKERVQQFYTSEIILRDVDELLNSSEKRDNMLDKYAEIRTKLGTQSASETMIRDLISCLSDINR